MSAPHFRLFIVSVKSGLSQDFFYSWCWICESLYVQCKWIEDAAGSFVDVWVRREDRNSVEVWKWEFRRSCFELTDTHFDATSLKVDGRL